MGKSYTNMQISRCAEENALLGFCEGFLPPFLFFFGISWGKLYSSPVVSLTRIWASKKWNYFFKVGRVIIVIITLGLVIYPSDHFSIVSANKRFCQNAGVKQFWVVIVEWRDWGFSPLISPLSFVRPQLSVPLLLQLYSTSAWGCD